MWTVAQLAHDLAAGRTTSRELVEQALMRIAAAYGEGPRAFLKVYEDAARTDADHADAAEGELDHVGPPHENGAGGAQPRHRAGVLLCDERQHLGPGARDVARHIEEVLERNRQAIHRRAPHAALAQRVGVIRIGARRVLVNLEEGARAFAIGGSDTHERLLDELAARGAPGGKVVRELGYSPHGARILCVGTSPAYFSAAAASCVAARRIESLPHVDCSRSEEHTSELQSRRDLVCRLLLEKKKNKSYN